MCTVSHGNCSRSSNLRGGGMKAILLCSTSLALFLKKRLNMIIKICAVILLFVSMWVVYFSEREDSGQMGVWILILMWLMLIYDKIN